MKKIEIQPLSALLGAGIAVLGMLSLGAQSPGAVVPTHLEVPKVVEHVVKVKGVPAPEEMWSSIRTELYQMQPSEEVVIYTVPMDKRLVLTHWSTLGDPDYVWLGWNGVAERPVAHKSDADHNFTGGISFPPGSDLIIKAAPGGGDMQERLYGYLTEP